MARLHESIVQTALHQLDEDSAEGPHGVFLRYVHSLVLDCNYEDLPEEDILDGCDEKQIDALVLSDEQNNASAQVHIFQVSRISGFPTNKLTLLGNGLSWLIEKPRRSYEQLANKKFIRKIQEFRQTLNKRSPSGMIMNVYFVTLGSTRHLPPDFVQERSQILERFTPGGWEQFNVTVLGSSELVTILNMNERARRKLDDRIRIAYDANVPSLIEYVVKDRRGIICTVPATEIARLVTGSRSDGIFDSNIRKFYGLETGTVNPDIADTCSDADGCHDFWFFNNGITIVCDHFDVVRNPDDPAVIMKNVQIVNGCQTSMTLAKQQHTGKLRPATNVLVKIFATGEQEFVGRIVLTTNNQNAISSRDLKANDPVQIDYQRAFKETYGLRWERKAREYASLNSSDRRNIVSNEKAGQAYLAVVMKRPTTARAQKYKVWDNELYRHIYPHVSVERHVLSWLIYDYCAKRKKRSLEKWRDDDVRYSIVSYGIFHLARVVAYYYTGLDEWRDQTKVNAWIEGVRKDPNVLSGHYLQAVFLLRKIVCRLNPNGEEINNVFKATEIEKEINRRLHKET